MSKQPSPSRPPTIVSRTYTLPLAFFIDGIIVYFVIGPSVVAAWRGTWHLMDVYLVPESLEQSAWISFVSGLGVIFILNFLQHPLLALTEIKLRIPINDYRVISRVHSFVLGLAVINMWRGFWTIQDIYLTMESNNIFLCGLIGLVLLWSCRAIKNASFPPLGVARDSKEGLFKFVTRLRTDNNMLTTSWEEMSYYLLDVFLTYAVIHSLIVIFWRSVWLLTDAMLFPNDVKTSAYASLLVGYSIYLIYIPLQFPAALVAKSIPSFFLRIAFEDFYHFVLHMGLVNAWRGTWMLYDLYIFPGKENKWLSGVVTCVGGVLVLYCIDTARSIGCVGCAIDAGEEDGASVYLEHYLHIVRKWRRAGGGAWVRGIPESELQDVDIKGILASLDEPDHPSSKNTPAAEKTRPKRQGPAPIYIDDETQGIEVPYTKKETIVSVGTHSQFLTTPVTTSISTQTEHRSRHRTNEKQRRASNKEEEEEEDNDPQMKEVIRHVRGSLGHFHLSEAELLDLLGKPDTEC